MNHAVIDLGSNTIRLVVFGFEDGKVTKVMNEKDAIGLAGYINDGVLSIDGIMKACKVVNDLKKLALDVVEPSDIHLFATASLRNVKNREEAVGIIADETSLTVDVLDGEEEGRLGFIGAKMSIDFDNGILIDIGGASTELVVFKNGNITDIASMPIGSLSLYRGHVSETMPTADERACIKQAVDEQLSEIGWAKDMRIKRMVGIGGTLRAAQKLMHAFFDLDEKDDIDASRVKDLMKLLKGGDADVHHKLCKTIPDRVLTICPGLIVLIQVIKKFGCETVTVSGSGIRDGYLWSKVLKKDE